MDLRGKGALVTGGARRLGRVFVLALAKAGMDVVVHYGHAAQEAENTAQDARSFGVRAFPLRADLTRAEEASRLIQRATHLLGTPPRVLINNAALFDPGTLRDTSLDNWVAHMRLNLRAPFLLMQAFAQALDAHTPGKIVNITDWRALHPGRKYLAYTISKAGLITLTLIAARELAPSIQVNALALGAVLPPPDRDETYLQQLVRNIPLRRAASTEEVADALLFLLRNDYITGETLLVDGGAHLGT